MQHVLEAFSKGQYLSDRGILSQPIMSLELVSEPTCDGVRGQQPHTTNGYCGLSGSGHSEEEQKQLYQWKTGTGDGSNQPIIHGMRLPTAEEMQHSQSIGMPTPMAPGDTYQQAVANWATYQCNSGGARAHPGFCEWSYTIGNKPADGWDALWSVAEAALLAVPITRGGAAASDAVTLPKLDKVFQFPGAGRTGAKVKDFVGPPNVVARGASPGRVFVTDDQGRVIFDITRDRVKPVVPGQGFIRGDGRKLAPTAEQLAWIEVLWGP